MVFRKCFPAISAVHSERFTVYEAEWWRFDYRDWRLYPITNLTFERIRKR